MKKTYISTLVITSLFIFNGCGGGGSPTSGKNTSSSPYSNLPTVDIKYTLNGKKRPTCDNATLKGELNPSPQDTVICSWVCARYKGDEVFRVLHAFKKNPQTEEGIWELTDTSVMEASQLNCRDLN